MRPDIDWIAKRDALRATAEALLPEFGKVFPDKRPAEILLNELLIHKVELEVQIDELRRSNIAMEESRDRYLELYDRSPVGFITVNRDGLITELNLHAAQLIGIDRSNILNKRLDAYIDPIDIDNWNLHFLKVIETGSSDIVSISVRMFNTESKVFSAYIYCQRIDSAGSPSSLRLTVIELSQVCSLRGSISLA